MWVDPMEDQDVSPGAKTMFDQCEMIYFCHNCKLGGYYINRLVTTAVVTTHELAIGTK